MLGESWDGFGEHSMMMNQMKASVLMNVMDNTTTMISGRENSRIQKN